MSDAVNEPQAEGVVPPRGPDVPVQPQPAAGAIPAAAAFPDLGPGTGLDKGSASVPPPTMPATLPPSCSRRCRRARWEGCRPPVRTGCGCR